MKLQEHTIQELITKVQQLESEVTFFKTIAESSSDWDIFRNQEGKILYVSIAFERITGFCVSDLHNGKITEKDLVHPEDWEAVEANLASSLNNKVINDLEFRIICKDKSLKYINLSANPVYNESVFIGVKTRARDITDDKKQKILSETLHHLQESELKFRKYIENSPLAIFITDQFGNYTYVNPAACEILEYEENELLQLSIPKILPPDCLDEGIENFRELCEKGITRNFQTRLKRKNNETVEIILDGIKISNTEFVAFVKDISEQKKANQLLRMQNDEYQELNEEFKATLDELINAKDKAEESESQFRQLFENMEQGFALHQMIYDANENPIDYRFILVNNAFVNLTGLSRQNLIGKTIKEIIPDIEQIWIERYSSVAKIGIPLHFDNYSSGLQKHYDVVAYCPKKNYFAVIFTDVTKNKNFEAELRKAKEKAEESDNLKSAFLQNMSHEIRTPMNAIIGFSDLLNKQDLTPEKRSSFISIIQNSTKQLLAIVSDILTISALETKQEKLNVTKTNINRIIADLHAIFSIHASNQNIALYAKQPLDDIQAEIYSDSTKLNQIITNLLTNAMKFTQNGYIEFGYKLIDKSAHCFRKIEANTFQGSHFILFYVKDTGIGIAPEHQDKIFERFRQAETGISKRFGGTGLGLSISKGFAELLGGKIWVESEINKGSCFCFIIPYNPVNKVEPSNGIANLKQVYPTVLIAEDEEFNFLYIEELLSQKNINILHAKDGIEAVEFCKNNPNIKLILMDIKMPLKDGHTAAKEIKEFRPNLPIIAQSAYALEHEIKMFSKGGFDDYLTKPINVEKLFESIANFIKI